MKGNNATSTAQKVERYIRAGDIWIIPRGGFSIVKFLFPNPIEDQGQPSYRGADYLIVALYYARLPPTAINRKLDLLTSFLDVCLE